jgi:hypothetical protein
MSTKPNADVGGQWPPRWNDVDGVLLREYADTPRIKAEGHTVRCRTGNASKFILWFIPIFGAVFMLIVYPTIEVPKFRAVFLLMAPLSLVSVFAITYGFARYHENLGDYLYVDISNKTVELPRYRQSVDLDSIVCFQFIAGYRYPFSRHASRKWSRQLNVLVWHDNKLSRYHLIGNPRKTLAKDLADSTGIPLTATTCPSGYFLCSDKDGSGEPSDAPESASRGVSKMEDQPRGPGDR